MQLKKYADTDFFLALMKESDWLKEKAKKIYQGNIGNIWVTPFTIVEMMVICKREGISIKETLVQISRIAKLDTIAWDVFFNACDHINKGATIFDSLLMSFCGENIIISSDKIYKKFGCKIINLNKD